MKQLLLSVFVVLAVIPLSGQGFVFGIKGGLTVGTQKWNTFQRDPLLKPHGIVFIESLSENDPFALFAQAGFHQKGSAIRNRNFFNPNNNTFFQPPTYEFIFYNASLVLGAKQKFEVIGKNKAYWMFGLRGDYTIDTNLEEFDDINLRSPIFPSEGDRLVRDFNYGVTVGGGIEFPLTELIGAIIEFTANPDFSLQYEQPTLNINFTDEYGRTWTTIPERKIRNLTFEVTLGFRFLRKIEYID